MFVEEIKSPDAVNRVRASEKLYLTPITDPKSGVVEMPHFGKFASHAIIGSNAVKVPTLDHERPGRNERGHLGIVELRSQIELKDLVLAGPYITVA
jgi:hypothetical protein